MEPQSRLFRLIEEQSSHRAGPALDVLRRELLTLYGGAVDAILFYGSCLRNGNPLDGLVDLYVVVSGYRAAYGIRSTALWNWLLPPNVFYLELPCGETTLRAKYAVISLADLHRATSMRWFHSYFWARLAQPSGLLYVRDEAVSREIITCLSQAVVTFLRRVLPQLPEEFTNAQAWQRGLVLTYQAELRTETSARAIELYEANRNYYTVVGEAAMAHLPHTVSKLAGAQPLLYHAEIPVLTRRLNTLGWMLRRIQGKPLSLLRLVKALFTFHGGVDYIAWKLHRHTGVQIEVTPELRRHPLVYGWAALWRLYRRGIFR
jgi:hypothetical protein